jgi:hypothetical protein
MLESVFEFLFYLLIDINAPFSRDEDGRFRLHHNLLGLFSYVLNIAATIFFAVMFVGLINIFIIPIGHITALTAFVLALFTGFIIWFGRNSVLYTLQLRATLLGTPAPGRHARRH